MRDGKSRKGFSLIELMIAVVVLGIIGAITVTAGTSAQKRARVTSAMTVFDNYKAAFNTAIMDHPGLVTVQDESYRAEKGHDTVTHNYVPVAAFESLVGYMNRSLSDDLKLELEPGGKYYQSHSEDPWGGKYVMLAYPEDPASSFNQWDFQNDRGNRSTLRLSIWCTGPDSDIIVPDTTSGEVEIREISVGLTLVDSAGTLTAVTHGGEDGTMPYLGWKIRHTFPYTPIS